MVDPLLPVTVSAGQIAEVALRRCSDEVEVAASDLAAQSAHYGIDSARITVRRMLLDYALDAVAITAAQPYTTLDASSTSDGALD